MASIAQKSSTLMRPSSAASSKSVFRPVRLNVNYVRSTVNATCDPRSSLLTARAAADGVVAEKSLPKAASAVKNVGAKDLTRMIGEGWTMLDVRPPGEIAKVSIDGAVQVPIYIEDPEGNTPAGLIKQSLQLGMGGWWMGGVHMVPNPNFMGEVQAKVPKDAKVIVGCQKGLRSLAACEAMVRAGYTSVAWVNGGFDTCVKGDLPTSPDNKDIRYAGVGGVGGMLGWTDVQREEGKENLGGQSGVINFFIFLLACDAALFAYEYWMQYQATGKLPF